MEEPYDNTGDINPPEAKLKDQMSGGCQPSPLGSCGLKSGSDLSGE